MIIGLCGQAGAGKDTVADFMVKNHGRINGLAKVAFADPLKRIARDVFAFTVEQLWGPSAMRNAPDKRYPREHYASKGVHCDCCGVDVELQADAQCYLTPRFALQQLGTEWGRRCYPNVWVDYALRVASQLMYGYSHEYNYYSPQSGLTFVGSYQQPSGVVISDVRFKNEIDALHSAGAKVVRIVRPTAGLEGAAGQHLSETEQKALPGELFDHHVLNKGGLDLLEAAAAVLLEVCRGP